MTELEQNKNQTSNIQEKSSLIWNIADILRGLYKPHEYGEIILPMTVIKRFHDVLLPTRELVLKKYEELEGFEMKDMFLLEESGFKFYNKSPFTFETLLSDPDNIEKNFRAYLRDFSENVRDILENFKFDAEISVLAENDKLYYIIQEFNSEKADFSLEKVSSDDMGYIFEDLVKRFSESYNEEAGAHFTSRDIIELMTDLLVSDERSFSMGTGIAKTIYDQAMGTSQMLSSMSSRIKSLDKDADITTFGQELNPTTYAIAKADTMIRGGDPNNMALGSTLSNDKFSGYTFDYCISNPPFGVDWKSDKKAVTEENERGENGRFAVGLPKISDGQLLFLLNGVAKLKDDGRMAIVHNGSALFSGAPASGESKIRQYIIEQDWLDAIVQLPTDLFYNTGITTYIWIISKNKKENRRGKVQLIDASKMYDKRRKSIGNKRNDLSEKYRVAISEVYGDFENKEYVIEGKTLESKIYDDEFFGFTRVTVESPLKDENGENILKNKKVQADTSLRDTEDIPLMEDIEEYFKREVLPYNPDAWMDRKKDKIGYEIPFTRLFYKYSPPEKSEVIASRIKELEERIIKSFNTLSDEEVQND